MSVYKSDPVLIYHMVLYYIFHIPVHTLSIRLLLSGGTEIPEQFLHIFQQFPVFPV